MMKMILSAATYARLEYRYPAPRRRSGARLANRVGNDRTAVPYRRDSPLTAAFLIYGAAIRNLPNSSRFTNMQFSNRRLKRGLTIISLAFLEKTCRATSFVISHLPLANEFLIATFDISENELSTCKRASYQNSNSNKKGLLRLVSSLARTARTPARESAAGKLHPEKVISYRAGERRILVLLARPHAKSLTSEEVSYITTKGCQ
jgi:hypothetical protein